MEKITNEIAEKVVAWFEGDEVQDAIKSAKSATDTGSFEVVITTENLDRYQEVISLDAWELDHYKANPVVLWGHDHFTLPIGVATDIEVKDGKMIARGKFAAHEHAQSIRQLYDMGVVRATSVGFIEKEREGNLITKAELLEFSFVSVPANPYALKLDTLALEDVSTLVTKGIFDIKDIKEEEKDTGTDPVTTPEESIEEPEFTPEDQKFAEHVADLVVKRLKDGSGLEDTEEGEPEPTEEPEEEDTEEEKALREFSERRRILQQAATIISEDLAERRKEIEARKEA